MDDGEQARHVSRRGMPLPAPRRTSAAGALPRFSLRSSDVQLYRLSEALTELLLYGMVVFSPWAFGTTEPWSVWTLNAAGYLLGVLWVIKLAIRRLKGYRPPRWDDAPGPADNEAHPRGKAAPRLTTALAVLTGAILVYCLIGALNARSTYYPHQIRFEYHDYVPWLPHSFDRSRTWLAFFTLLGLAGSFWAVRDWLLGKTDGEERAERRPPPSVGAALDSAPFLPARLRRLLWVLAINGGLLGLEGIAQRLEGSGHLLFLVKPRVNPGAETQFGPYAYRANAAQYFNLLWPVCLGFWWTLHRSGGFRRARHHLLLVCGVIMAACPIISTSRGGALITGGFVVASAYFLLYTHIILVAARQQTRRTRWLTLAAVMVFFGAALAVGYWLGWKPLKPRLDQISEGFVLREEMYDVARPMMRDYPWFGIGPGAFEYVFQLYRISPRTYWPAQLHNDWLETRITYGLVGTALILSALALVLLRWFFRGGIHGGRRFVILMWLALAGCLVHARFDFPFQVHSIQFLFILLCAILVNLSRRP